MRMTHRERRAHVGKQVIAGYRQQCPARSPGAGVSRPLDHTAVQVLSTGPLVTIVRGQLSASTLVAACGTMSVWGQCGAPTDCPWRQVKRAASRHWEARTCAKMCPPGRHGVQGDRRDTRAARRGQTVFCHTRWVMRAVCGPGPCSPSWRLIRVRRPTAVREASCVLTGRLRGAGLRRDLGTSLRNLTRLGCWHVAPCQYRC
jgi:hypothetical protein